MGEITGREGWLAPAVGESCFITKSGGKPTFPTCDPASHLVMLRYPGRKSGSPTCDPASALLSFAILVAGHS
jgi:hypothetical protein